MLKFKEFIEEKWRLSTGETKIYGKRHYADNVKDIDGHEVRVDFAGNADHHYGVNYTVNGSYYKTKPVHPETAKKILNHVNKSIGTFIRHVKPKSVSFGSKIDSNISMHDNLAKRIARRHGGTVTVTDSPNSDMIHHKIEFNR